MSFDLARLAAGVLHVPEHAPDPVALAADELGAYLGRIFGTAPVLRPHPAAGEAWLCLAPPLTPVPTAALASPAPSEYAVRPVGDVAVVTGATPRSLLAGVYALLEAAGCRWSPHGPDDEHVPGAAEARRTLPPVDGRPVFARRAYAADLATWHCTMPERLAERLPGDVAFVDWMAKSGATGFLFIRHANDAQWVVPDLVPELRRRGLEVEVGGHALVELLPRGLFAAHPEYFPVGAEGRRTDLGNACTASREALALISERARAPCAAVPGAAGLHLWGMDLLGGGWCACAGCAGLSPSDQSLRLCNAAAEALGTGRHVFHLAYHDTLPPPHIVRAHPRVWAEFAPRERCYAHPLDDPGCAVNPRYRRALEAHLELFEGRVDVFEYYADAILFGGCAVPLARIVADDLDYYARAGVRGVSCLTFGQYSLWAYGVNVEAFARGAVRPASAAGALAAHCDRRFGVAAEPMGRYLAALEELLAEVVTYGDLLLPPPEVERAAAARAALDRGLARAPALRRLLADASGGSAPGARIAAEQRLLDYTLGALAAVRGWLAARLDDAGEEALEQALAALAETARHVRAAGTSVCGTWGAYDLPVTHHSCAATLRARRPGR